MLFFLESNGQGFFCRFTCQRGLLVTPGHSWLEKPQSSWGPNQLQGTRVHRNPGSRLSALSLTFFLRVLVHPVQKEEGDAFLKPIEVKVVVTLVRWGGHWGLLEAHVFCFLSGCWWYGMMGLGTLRELPVYDLCACLYVNLTSNS